MGFFLCLAEQEDLEQVYKDRAARDMEHNRERERTQSSLDEISLGMAGTMIEGTDTSESETQKPLMGCGDGLSGSYSLDHPPETLSAAYQHRQGSSIKVYRRKKQPHSVATSVWLSSPVCIIESRLKICANFSNYI